LLRSFTAFWSLWYDISKVVEAFNDPEQNGQMLCQTGWQKAEDGRVRILQYIRFASFRVKHKPAIQKINVPLAIPIPKLQFADFSCMTRYTRSAMYNHHECLQRVIEELVVSREKAGLKMTLPSTISSTCL
jgi:hypothetical protein